MDARSLSYWISARGYRALARVCLITARAIEPLNPGLAKDWRVVSKPFLERAASAERDASVRSAWVRVDSVHPGSVSIPPVQGELPR